MKVEARSWGALDSVKMPTIDPSLNQELPIRVALSIYATNLLSTRNSSHGRSDPVKGSCSIGILNS
ncbi:MAG: hypothetical protein HC780_06305 [Leptolyngbyaceae cyanobacterium CSU_1_3]|nr:hypothetical protein [Leptolyngbyaceae cyanobacterium CSU_1_3]